MVLAGNVFLDAAVLHGLLDVVYDLVDKFAASKFLAVGKKIFKYYYFINNSFINS